jgi:N-methylhydantoinase A
MAKSTAKPSTKAASSPKAKSSGKAAGRSGVTRLATDIGGTFTDVVLEEGGRRITRKLLTTPQRPRRPFSTGCA